MASMRYVSGDGYSRMFEPPEPEPEEPQETPEEAEFRMLRAALLQRRGGGLQLSELDRFAPVFGVPVTADILHRAILEIDERHRRWAEREAERPGGQQIDWLGTIRANSSHEPVVYYMLHGGLVKIGTSTDLKKRLENIEPERLLAVEPGSYDVESARHRQFAEWHSHGEWFLPSSPLEEHMARTRNVHADLFAPWASWRPATGRDGKRRMRLGPALT